MDCWALVVVSLLWLLFGYSAERETLFKKMADGDASIV